MQRGHGHEEKNKHRLAGVETVAERDFFDIDEVARLLHVTPADVLEWTRQGLPFMYRHGKYLFVKENVIEWAEREGYRKDSPIN